MLVLRNLISSDLKAFVVVTCTDTKSTVACLSRPICESHSIRQTEHVIADCTAVFLEDIITDRKNNKLHNDALMYNLCYFCSCVPTLG